MKDKQDNNLLEQFDKTREKIKAEKNVPKQTKFESRAEDMKRVKAVLNSLDAPKTPKGRGN